MRFLGEARGRHFALARHLRLAAAFVALAALALAGAHHGMAQAPTATTVRAQLLSPTPEGLEAPRPTSTPAATATPLPAVRLRVLETAGNVNVRALPSLDSDILGTLAPNVEYQALRNYYRWYEFRFDASPTGRGWVYGDLIEIVGDRSKINIIDNPADITAPLQQAQAQSSAEDEAPRTIAISTLRAGSESAVELGAETRLPTFTPPAATPVSFTAQMESQAADPPPWEAVPPIAPIALLAGLGALGLLLNALRR